MDIEKVLKAKKLLEETEAPTKNRIMYMTFEGYRELGGSMTLEEFDKAFPTIELD